MAKRTMNFYAGPAALPLAALERARDEMVDYQGTGMSLLEHSHRGPAYDPVHREAMSLLREMMGIPDNYRVLLLQGGARQQFAMIPMNLLHEGKSADYLVTGNWSVGALGEANRVGTARAAATTLVDGKTTQVPTQADMDLDPDAAYLHLTSNNTLYGTQFHTLPETSAPIIADMTSDILCRPVDVSKYGMIYAGAQKNIGPAGVAVAIIREDLIASAREDIPVVFQYRTHDNKDSLWNTPPTFPIYMLRNTLAALNDLGGAAALEARNAKKAQTIYEAIDARPELYRCPVDEGSRSIMNAVFHMPTPEHEARFLEATKQAGMIGLKGHRKVGGVRVSMYNAVEPAWIDALAELMAKFEA
ncbi:MAG: 3-phosphoserine/phosphohydroxythreonine transaminase [Sandaracinaceae bacterium]